MATPSGFTCRLAPALDGARAADELAAAGWFPPVDDAIVVHVHTDPVTGLLAVGGEPLSAEEFHVRVLVPLMLERGQSPRQLLVMVACGLGAVRSEHVEAAAQALARLGNRPVLAASADVFTTPAGAVRSGRRGLTWNAGRCCSSRRAGGCYAPGRAEPVPFGPGLATVLADRELAEKLPRGTPVPGVGQHPEPAQLPADDVRWAMGVEIERHNVRLFWSSGGAFAVPRPRWRAAVTVWYRFSRTARGCGSASRAFCMTARRPWRRPGRSPDPDRGNWLARQAGVGAGDRHGAVAGAG